MLKIGLKISKFKNKKMAACKKLKGIFFYLIKKKIMRII